MKKQKLELRMYFLVMYNISPIQQGIQALHAVVEYFLKHWKDKEFWRWAKTHKTVIILNGGTSNKGHQLEYGEPKQLGSMEQHFQTLKDNKIKCASFYEPDLNHSMSAIAFFVDERVFNKEEYPDFQFGKSKLDIFSMKVTGDLKTDLSTEEQRQKRDFIKKVGKDVAFLKDFLKQFKFA